MNRQRRFVARASRPAAPTSGSAPRRARSAALVLTRALCAVLALAAALGAAETPPPQADPPAEKPVAERPAAAYVNDELPGWLKLSGEFRFRYEDRQGLGFVEGNDDGYSLVRTRVNLGVEGKPWLKLFFQGQDSRAPGHRNPNGVFKDTFDIRQAYVKIGGHEGSPVALTAGRQLLSYGDQRLIGALDWTNTSRAFDAVKLELTPTPDSKIDVFSSSVVANDPERRVNISPEGHNLHGVYGGFSELIPKSTLEPFALWQTRPLVSNELGIRGDLDRYTAGFRLWSKSLGRWDYNLALIRQWGSAAGADIAAWGSYAELGYSIDAPLAPRLYAEYTFGSGDSDPGDGRIGGFDDLYPTAHLWYGYNDLVGWRNLKNIRLGAELQPQRKLKVKFDYHSFWLANRNDGLYNVAGARTVAAPEGGAAAAKIGDEVDATFIVPLTPTVTIGGGVGYLLPGAFLEANTPGSGNTFTFLFTSFRF